MHDKHGLAVLQLHLHTADVTLCGYDKAMIWNMTNLRRRQHIAQPDWLPPTAFPHSILKEENDFSASRGISHTQVSLCHVDGTYVHRAE